MSRRGEGHCRKVEKTQEDRQVKKEGEGRAMKEWLEDKQRKTKNALSRIDILKRWPRKVEGVKIAVFLPGFLPFSI